MVLHWLYCAACGLSPRRDEAVDPEALPPCPQCGAPLRIDWSHGKPPATDVHEPRYYQGLEEKANSHRDALRQARRRAREWTNEMQGRGLPFSWDVDSAGDKVGGAREETRPTGRIVSTGSPIVDRSG